MGQPILVDQLWSGTSGQAPWVRKHGTVENAENIRFDIRLSAAAKRNAFRLIANLAPHDASAGIPAGTLDPNGSYYFTNIRSALIAIQFDGTNSEVLAWDANGDAIDIDDLTIVGTQPSTFVDYVSTITDVFRDLDVSDNFDTLIVCNRNTLPRTKDAFTVLQAMSFLVNGDPDDDSGVSPDDLLEVSFFSELPDPPVEGNYFHCILDEEQDPAGYYVYVPLLHVDYRQGFFPDHDNWFRIPSPSVQEAAYDETTMPYRLVYDEEFLVGTIVKPRLFIDVCPWSQRISGRKFTNPKMPWAAPVPGTGGEERAKPIKTVEFLSGRLFLCSNDEVTSSGVGDFFRLWVNNANAHADDDPIQQNMTHTNVGGILRSSMCGQALFLLAENGQLEFSSGEDALTSINGRIRVLTTYPSVDIQSGSGPGMVTIADQYGDVHQYSWGGRVDPSILYTDMLTVHTPKLFVGKTIQRIAQIGTTVALITDGGELHFHDSFNIQGQSVQSAWSTFSSVEPAKWLHQWNDVIRIITQADNGTDGFSLLHYNHRVIPAPNQMRYLPHADRLELIPVTQMTFREDTDDTLVTHLGRDGSLNADAGGTILITQPDHEFIVPFRLEGGDPVFRGDLTEPGNPVWLGFKFDTQVELTKLFARISAIREQFQSVTLFFFETSDFFLEVLRPWVKDTDADFEDSVFRDFWQAAQLDATQFGDHVLRTGSRLFGSYGDPRESVVRIKSGSAGPMVILAAEYDVTSTERQGK